MSDNKTKKFLNEVNECIKAIEIYKKKQRENSDCEAVNKIIKNLDWAGTNEISVGCEEQLTELYYIRDVLTELVKSNIILSKKYRITKDIYMQVIYDMYCKNFVLYFNFYDSSNAENFIYNNFIESYSGINEWLENTIISEYDLFTGNSKYNYAFGTTSLKEWLGIITNRKNEMGDREHSPKKVGLLIASVIDFFSDKNNECRRAMQESLEYKINILKRLAKEMENN